MRDFGSGYIFLFQTLLGGTLTFMGGLLGNWLIQRSQRRAETESLASAFYGEIGALLFIAEKKRYLELVTTALEQCRNGNKRDVVVFEVSRNFFNVYDRNVQKIGLLPAPVPEKVVLFYTLALAIVEDLSAIGKGRLKEYDTSEVEHILTELLTLFGNVIELGTELRALLAELDLARTQKNTFQQLMRVEPTRAARG